MGLGGIWNTYRATLVADARARQREYDRQWKLRNPITRRLQGHRRRARITDSTITQFTALQVRQRLSLWRGRCWICHSVIAIGDQQIDHVKPLQAQGPHCLANLRPACGACNAWKKDAWPFQPRCGCGRVMPCR